MKLKTTIVVFNAQIIFGSATAKVHPLARFRFFAVDFSEKHPIMILYMVFFTRSLKCHVRMAFLRCLVTLMYTQKKKKIKISNSQKRLKGCYKINLLRCYVLHKFIVSRLPSIKLRYENLSKVKFTPNSFSFSCRNSHNILNSDTLPISNLFMNCPSF